MTDKQKDEGDAVPSWTIFACQCGWVEPCDDGGKPDPGKHPNCSGCSRGPMPWIEVVPASELARASERIAELEGEVGNTAAIYGNRANAAEAERDRYKQALEEVRDLIRGIAGQLETPTALGRRFDRDLVEYRRRCNQAADRLRAAALEGEKE